VVLISRTPWTQYDLRASLDVDKEQLAREREDVARDVYSLLTR
jgi:hypothetical protein